MMDNATNNDSTLHTLSELLNVEQEFLYDAQEHCIQCFPHIINLCVQRTLSKYTKADFSNVPRSMWVNGSRNVVDKAKYVDMVESDPVYLEREFVSAIRASGQRQTGFRQTIKTGNETEAFTDSASVPTSLPVLQLVLTS